MGLGGVLLAGAGIIVAVLVANGRWPNVWNAALGSGAAPANAGAQSAQPQVSASGETQTVNY